MTPHEVAKQLHRWASENGFLEQQPVDVGGQIVPLSAIFPDEAAQIQPDVNEFMARLNVTGVFFGDAINQVTVTTHGGIGPRQIKRLPASLGGVGIEWIGSCPQAVNPPPITPQPQAVKRCFIHKGRIACGSSVTAAPIFSAGSMGCLVRRENGRLCGLSNNHVTGGCNHTEQGMPILIPSPVDASSYAGDPVPQTVGRHLTAATLASGDPRLVPPQEHDAAVFEILSPDQVTSFQGDGLFDTPAGFAPVTAGTAVKKVGRTTGLTHGHLRGISVAPHPISYKHERFNALVYLAGVISIQGANNQKFSEPGDSGSLVVTEDGTGALGLIVAGMGDITLMLPVEPTLKALHVTLVTEHNP